MQGVGFRSLGFAVVGLGLRVEVNVRNQAPPVL